MNKAVVGKWIVRLSLGVILVISAAICWFLLILPLTYTRQEQVFDLGDPAPVQMQVRAAKNHSYTVRLEYHFDAADQSAREQLWQALGGNRQIASGR